MVLAYLDVPDQRFLLNSDHEILPILYPYYFLHYFLPFVFQIFWNSVPSLFQKIIAVSLVALVLFQMFQKISNFSNFFVAH